MSYRGKRILVTGADGFIGSHLVEALVAEGAEVTALALYNAFGGNGWLDTLDDAVFGALTVERGDVRDAGFMDRLAAGHDTVFHLAALIAIPYSYAAPQSYVDVNMTGTLNVLEAARKHGVRRVVHTSTSEVYGTALRTPIGEDHPLQGQSPYAASKIGADKMAEAFARSFDLPVVVLRPFNTYGPRQSERAVIPTVIRQALDPKCAAIRVGDLTPRRDFNFVADTVDAFLKAGSATTLEYGVAYNSGSGQAVAIGEVVETVIRVTGCNKPVETEATRFRPEKSEVRELLADARRLGAATGWKPKVGLGEGIERTIAWWRERVGSGGTRRDAGYLT
ncbi:MAG: SDR family NAD(P)-dependent oxidoreductase [Candidatus Eiseniibacteriota bacterium]